MIRIFRSVAILLVVLVCAAVAQDLLSSQPSLWADKPDAAAFERIENDRLTAAQHSIDAIVAVKGARTIENTLAPYDQAVERIDAASHFADLMQNVHPDAAFRDRATAMVTKVSAANTALSLNREVYKALAALDVSTADAATQYYIQRQLLEFRLAGVDKDDATRTRLKQLNDQLTEAKSMFDRNISDDQRSVEIGSASELDGLPLGLHRQPQARSRREDTHHRQLSGLLPRDHIR